MTLGLEAILSPPILFFVLGFVARYVGTDLRLPDAISRFFSVYLLLVIGFEGGVKLSMAGFEGSWWGLILMAILFAIIHPIFAYALTRSRVEKHTAVALSASYGSVSVVTFIAALSFLDEIMVESNPQIVAVVALMEFPAIMVGVAIHALTSGAQSINFVSKKKLLQEAVLGSAPLILLGSLLIGAVTGQEGSLELKAFTQGLFKGFLSLYLLDLGARASRQLKESQLTSFHLLFGTLFPLGKGLFACMLFTWIFPLNTGDALLLSVLFASASYIAVPAAMESMLPTANRGIYVTLPLAVTFPLNVILGIPLYYQSILFFNSF